MLVLHSPPSSSSCPYLGRQCLCLPLLLLQPSLDLEMRFVMAGQTGRRKRSLASVCLCVVCGWLVNREHTMWHCGHVLGDLTFAAKSIERSGNGIITRAASPQIHQVSPHHHTHPQNTGTIISSSRTSSSSISTLGSSCGKSSQPW